MIDQMDEMSTPETTELVDEETSGQKERRTEKETFINAGKMIDQMDEMTLSTPETTELVDEETSGGKKKPKTEKEKETFINNAGKMIDQMDEMSRLTTSETTALVDEILHSIFFLGQFLKLPCTPEEIMSKVTRSHDELKEKYPRPFEFYSKQLPRRCPFKCVLDMVCRLIGTQTREHKHEEIMKKLQDIILPLEKEGKWTLISSTICRSKVERLGTFYGVSMSTSGVHPGRIMTAASCLSSWESNVAGAVMTYNIQKSRDPEQKCKRQMKKDCFDGRIKLPEKVTCEAFGLIDGSPKNPCSSCMALFGLTNAETTAPPYGNCAEAESLSKLFTKGKKVERESQPTSDMSTEENREKAKQSVKKELETILRCEGFETWDGQYYLPYTARQPNLIASFASLAIA